MKTRIESLLPDGSGGVAEFCKPLIGLPVSHVWQGYGSAIFLEFGELQPRVRRNRTLGNPEGEYTLGIEWSWRIEGKRRIWCGSWSESVKWPGVFARLKGAKVDSVRLYGRLPEIEMTFSNGLHLLSMMTAEGDPEWALTKREGRDSVSIHVRAARVWIERVSEVKSQ